MNEWAIMAANFIMFAIQPRVREIARRSGGTFGLVVEVIRTGEEIVINEDETFPAASIIKVPVLLEAFRQALEGRLSLDEQIVLREEDEVGGMGVLKELTAGLKLPFIDISTLMIIISDNVAANVVITKVGMKNANSFMKGLGLRKTLLQRKMMDFEARKRGLDNYTSPRDMADLLHKLYAKTILNEWSCEKVLDIMKKQQVNDRIPRYLPEGIPVAHKTGELAGVRHDVGIVFAKEPFIISAMVKDLKDPLSQTFSGGKGTEAIARISGMVFKAVNP
ncbi:MAG: serine hydrolase [Zestosphaera sp.]